MNYSLLFPPPPPQPPPEVMDGSTGVLSIWSNRSPIFSLPPAAEPAATAVTVIADTGAGSLDDVTFSD
jgi:hypothetical protein